MGIAKFKDRQYLIKLERIRKGRDAEFQLGLGTQPAAAAVGERWIIILNMERDSEQSDQDKWFSWAETEPCLCPVTDNWLNNLGYCAARGYEKLKAQDQRNVPICGNITARKFR